MKAVSLELTALSLVALLAWSVVRSADGSSATFEPDGERLETAAISDARTRGGPKERVFEPKEVPSPRESAAVAYDFRSDRIILFGGNTNRGNPGTLSSETWAYDLSANTWARRNPGVSPPGLATAGMAYDIQSDRTVLFGGSTYGFADEPSQAVVGDTWAYDFGNDSWERRSPAISPSARAAPSMAYDAGSDRVVLVGGYTGVSLNDTWTYDYEADTWTPMGTLAPPSTGDSAAIAYDTLSDRIVVFGGFVQSPHGDTNETWSYEFTSDMWSRMAPGQSPLRRWIVRGAYDSSSDRVVIFGGFRGWTVMTPLMDTWAYDVDGDAWTDRAPATRPAARCCHAMAYDAQSGRTVLFGGRTSALANDVWAYDYAANVWIDMTIPGAPRNPFLSPGDRQLILTWDPPASPGGSPTTVYRVYRGTVSGVHTLLAEVPPTSLTYSDSGLAVGVRYYYLVSAVSALGEGPFSQEVAATTATVPSAPQSVTAGPGDRQVTLSWGPPADDGGSPILSYSVYRDSTRIDVEGATSFVDTGLANDVTYTYRVSARNTIGEGANSSAAEATPTAPPPPPPPTPSSDSWPLMAAGAIGVSTIGGLLAVYFWRRRKQGA
ncbi:MAG TPA: kelch repeat-containing protein [Thermoplasmata archaeon]|nr:kelch repeat-containing protein [Thermoplasmata archaeon]